MIHIGFHAARKPGFNLGNINKLTVISSDVQYVYYSYGSDIVRKGIRDGNLVIDITLTATGFAGTENTDWVNLYSSVIDQTTTTAPTTTFAEILSDWYLPSRQELNWMYQNLHTEGVGDFATTSYWSSTELSATQSWAINFTSGLQSERDKTQNYYVRACRSIIASPGAYSLRDTGPGGGLIFTSLDNYDGTHTFFEAAASDQSTSKAWSNITDTAIGTTSPNVGEGKNNTDEIMAQSGHTDSAAKVCDDLN